MLLDFRTAIGASASGASNFGVGDITGATALTTGLADTDELILNDAGENSGSGALKRMDISVLKSHVLTAASASDVGLGSAASDITTNATNIATNVTNLATNTSGIATNTSGIATNVTNITTNTSGIATNVTNITTNTSGIALM